MMDRRVVSGQMKNRVDAFFGHSVARAQAAIAAAGR
jgi:hypothetical protein